MLSLHKLIVSSNEDLRRITAYYFQHEMAPRPEAVTVAPRTSWIGGGLDSFHLIPGAAVDAEQFCHLLGGFNPIGKIFTRKAPGRRHVAGVDLTYSTVKSRSLLRAAANAATRAAMDQRLLRAIAATLRYAEQNGYFIRRTGPGGRNKSPAEIIAALFLHHTSRDGDPQDHAHGIVLNAVWGQAKDDRTGGWGGRLEFRKVFDNKIELGAVFRAELARLDRELGFEIERRGEFFEYRGISPEAIVYYSKGARRIRDAAGAGASSRRKEIVGLYTREEKIFESPQIRDQIHRTELFEKFGIDEQTVLRARTAPAPILDSSHPRFDLDEVIDNLAASAPFFRVEDLRREIAKAAAGVYGAAEIQALAQTALKSPRVLTVVVPVTVKDKEAGQPIAAWIERYASRENYSADRRIASWIKRASACRKHALSPEAVALATAQFETRHGETMSTELFSGVLDLTAGGDFVAIEGASGPGAGTILAAAKCAYAAAGYRTLTISDRNSIPARSDNSTNTPNMTLADLVFRTRGRPGEDPSHSPYLDFRTVLFLEEAAALSSVTFEWLRQAVEPSGAKLIVVGRGRRRQVIAGTPAWPIVLANTPRVTRAKDGLRTIYNYRKEYGPGLAREPAAATLISLAESGKLIVGEDSGLDQVLKQFRRDADACGPENSSVLTTTDQAAHVLNQAIRAELRVRGVLGPTDFRAKVLLTGGAGARETSFAAGDRIITRGRHQKRIKSGEIYIITDIQQKEPGRLVIEMKRPRWKRKTIMIDTQEFNRFDHSYAAASPLNRNQRKSSITYWLATSDIAHFVDFHRSHLRHRQVANVVVSYQVILGLAKQRQRSLMAVSPVEAAITLLDAMHDESRLRKTSLAAKLKSNLPGNSREQFSTDSALLDQLRQRVFRRMILEDQRGSMPGSAPEARTAGLGHNDGGGQGLPASTGRRSRKPRDFLQIGVSGQALGMENAHLGPAPGQSQEAAKQRAMRTVKSAERQLLNLTLKIRPTSAKRFQAARAKMDIARQAYLAMALDDTAGKARFTGRCRQVDEHFDKCKVDIGRLRQTSEASQVSLHDLAKMTSDELKSLETERERRMQILRDRSFRGMEEIERGWDHAPAGITIDALEQFSTIPGRTYKTDADALSSDPTAAKDFATHNTMLTQAAGDMKASVKHENTVTNVESDQKPRRLRIVGPDM